MSFALQGSQHLREREPVVAASLAVAPRDVVLDGEECISVRPYQPDDRTCLRDPLVADDRVGKVERRRDEPDRAIARALE